MTTNTLVIIAMAPVEPLEDRDRGGDRWLRIKVYCSYASGVTLKYRSEVAGPTITSYAVIRLDRRQSLPYDRSESKRSPRINQDYNRDRSGALMIPVTPGFATDILSVSIVSGSPSP